MGEMEGMSDIVDEVAGCQSRYIVLFCRSREDSRADDPGGASFHGDPT